MTKYKNNYFVDGSKITGNLKHCAYVIFKNDKIKKSVVLQEDLNVYEVEGLAVFECLEMAPYKSRIFCDNQQIVKELNDKKEPKDLEFYEKCKELMNEKNIQVLKVKRDENHAGRYLEKRLTKIKNSINHKYKWINL